MGIAAVQYLKMLTNEPEYEKAVFSFGPFLTTAPDVFTSYLADVFDPCRKNGPQPVAPLLPAGRFELEPVPPPPCEILDAPAQPAGRKNLFFFTAQRATPECVKLPPGAKRLRAANADAGSGALLYIRECPLVEYNKAAKIVRVALEMDDGGAPMPTA
ncbi:unnamed protein product [Prorocentrum cordatum]|uniref:Uncharacterized protein n=1 Tax=Prorocentrum cordatum TaxID=2364126 RepID=A0ABN9WSS1_9DINO|nr:unnamed protein product [Polarella glacialis]